MATIDPRFGMPFSNDPPERRGVSPQGNDLDRNAFLNLLMTQLRYQDPLNPMDDREFIAQMAQFSALEQMTNLNSTFNRFQAFNMIGQTVMGFARNPVTGQSIEIAGLVDSVSVIAGETWLNIIRADGTEAMLRASDVQVAADDSTQAIFTMLRHIREHMSTDSLVNQSLALVGRHIQAVMTNSRGEAIGFVEGKVDFVDFTTAFPTLAIGNERVQVHEVVAIGDRPMIIGQDVVYFDADGNSHTGRITAINIRGDNAYAHINGADVRIDHINFLTEALNLRNGVPREIVTYNNERVTVSEVVVQNGAVRVELRRESDGTTLNIPYSQFINNERAPITAIGQTVGFYHNDVFTAAGLITDIVTVDGNTYAVINGNNHRIDNARWLSEAINMREQQETFLFEDEPSRVVSVRIVNGATMVTVRETRVDGEIHSNIPFSRFAEAN